MLKTGVLAPAFKVYRDEMQVCLSSKAYWALLHVTVCLPDVCAALQSNDGEANPSRYKYWCDVYFNDPRLNNFRGVELYEIRCKVLHQGSASAKKGQYAGYSFAQPSSSGAIDHGRLDGTTLIVDVGELSKKVEDAVESWIAVLESKPNGTEATNTDKNLKTLVQVRQFPIPPQAGQTMSISSIDIINRTS